MRIKLLLAAATVITSLAACGQSTLSSAFDRMNIPVTRVWSVKGQIMLGVAQNDWQNGRLLKTGQVLYLALKLMIRDIVNREKAYQYLKQSEELFQQSEVTEALNVCWTAAKLYDEEGATTYRCMKIESQFRGMSAPTIGP
ncbi:MAG TPA: hypothetical protein VFL17_10335 [Anaerolineae bacterium]|nr:hypothetical protein [Anaerolineae bacterium]